MKIIVKINGLQSIQANVLIIRADMYLIEYRTIEGVEAEWVKREICEIR